MFLNSSRVATWNLCHRRFFWEQLFNGTGLIGKAPKDYLVTGIAVHEGLAALYSKQTTEEAAAIARAKYLADMSKDWDGLILQEWTEQADFCAKMVGTYAKEKPEDDFRVVGVEQEFIVPLGEMCWSCGSEYPMLTFNTETPQLACNSCGVPVHYWVGRTDLDIQRRGHLEILDHKTTSSTPSDDFLSGFGQSFQLLGYVYGRGKSAGYKIEGFGVNALQKAKTLGTEQASTKRCPSCRNGIKKRVGCTTCDGSGRVEKEAPLAPFRRQYFPVVPSDIDRFVLTMHSNVQDIEREKQRFKADPLVAFPMNDKTCKFNCPFVDACWNTDPTKWWEPDELCIKPFKPRPQDYVDVKQIILEESE
jgi:hypothetical protein